MFAPLKRQSATFSRWLGALLVVFILYGTTVEAAHRHGRVLPSQAAGATSQLDNQQTGNLKTTRTGCSDCLICQLHQSFSTTLIVVRLNEPPAQQPHRFVSTVHRVRLSQIISPLAGRAPPSIS